MILRLVIINFNLYLTNKLCFNLFLFVEFIKYILNTEIIAENFTFRIDNDHQIDSDDSQAGAEIIDKALAGSDDDEEAESGKQYCLN